MCPSGYKCAPDLASIILARNCVVILLLLHVTDNQLRRKCSRLITCPLKSWCVYGPVIDFPDFNVLA